MTVFLTKDGRLYSTSSESELKNFGQNMGLKKSWLRQDEKGAYYRLSGGGNMNQAIKHGAIWDVPSETITVKSNTPQVILPSDKKRRYTKSRIRLNYVGRDTITKQAEWLRSLRKEYHLTQREFADLVDVGRNVIANIEIGDQGITEEVAFKIAQGIGLPKEKVVEYIGKAMVGVRETTVPLAVPLESRVFPPEKAPSFLQNVGSYNILNKPERLEDFTKEQLLQELERREKNEKVITELRNKLKRIGVMKQHLLEEETRLRRELSKYT